MRKDRLQLKVEIIDFDDNRKGYLKVEIIDNDDFFFVFGRK